MDNKHSNETSTKAPSEQGPYVYNALLIAQKAVRQRHPALRVGVPPPQRLADLFQDCAKRLKDDSTSLGLSTFPALTDSQRQALRSVAIRAQKDEGWYNNEGGSSGQPIVSHGLLQSAPSPKPLTAERRRRVKENFADFLNTPEYPDPYFTLNTFLESNLPTLECKLRLTAVDSEVGMPEAEIGPLNAIWDTGAHRTIITDDLVSEEFRAFLRDDDIHNPYRSPGKSQVQVSGTLEFSNYTLLEFDIIALVVPRAHVPNQRSGILLGQAGIIDSLRYDSVPRKIAILEDSSIPEDRWGLFNVHCYHGLEGVERFD